MVFFQSSSSTMLSADKTAYVYTDALAELVSSLAEVLSFPEKQQTAWFSGGL